jgi:hypothetical protein
MDGSIVAIADASSGLGLLSTRATSSMLIDSYTTPYSPELGVQYGEETKTPLPRVVEAICQELHLESV